MTRAEKINLTNIRDDETFNNVLKKIVTNNTLNNVEQEYLLSVAIILIQIYKNDNRKTSYIELSYYLILKYTIITEDTEPLNDFALNFGFYPISYYIMKYRLTDFPSINSLISFESIQHFVLDDYVQTLEQKKARDSLKSLEYVEQAYIAPTSYGKSSLINEIIGDKISTKNRIAIIVPSKSLLMQTFRMIKRGGYGRRIIIHDEMFTNDEKFIGVLTQERALRLLQKNDVYFDLLFIDEAHNIFEKDARSVLLTRLIRRAKSLYGNLQIVYLSPLIENVRNMKIYSNQEISESRVNFTVKEPEVFEYRLDNSTYIYNRFLNNFYSVDVSYSNWKEYLVQNLKNKNLIYIRRPVKIEQFALEIADVVVDTSNKEIDELIETLRNYIHPRFYMVDLLKKGIVYLHGKLPELLKEYLEEKFRTIKNLRLLIANTVILEGMNLPIESLFIFNTYHLNPKDMTNLIGRVNRMNDIFRDENTDLTKLLPPVHFVNTESYNRIRSSMKNTIERLRSRVLEDKVENPILVEYDIDKLKYTEERKERELARAEKIKSDEEVLYSNTEDPKINLKKQLVEHGLSEFFRSLDDCVEFVTDRIFEAINLGSDWFTFDLLYRIYYIFIDNNKNIIDSEIDRLKYEETRQFYLQHVVNMHERSLRENVESLVKYFHQRRESDDAYFYVGASYGDAYRPSEEYPFPQNLVYVDLSKKTEQELVNLSIVKLKMEDDFVSFKLNKFVNILFDHELITKDEFNTFIHGTTDIEKLEFSKYGMSGNLISRLERDGQLMNLTFDENKNLIGNAEFNEYVERADDYYKYEIRRML